MLFANRNEDFFICIYSKQKINKPTSYSVTHFPCVKLIQMQNITAGTLEFFTNYTKLAIMPILASEALLREKKSSDKMLPPVEPRPLITSDSKSNIILSTLT